jgi:hypothetical protein
MLIYYRAKLQQTSRQDKGINFNHFIVIVTTNSTAPEERCIEQYEKYATD